MVNKVASSQQILYRSYQFPGNGRDIGVLDDVQGIVVA